MKIAVALAERSYDIHVGPGVRHDLAAVVAARAPRARRVAVVASDLIAAQPWFDLRSGRDQEWVALDDGEASKSFAHLEALCAELAARNLSRDDVVVAVGGGATTDLVGLAASLYRRGVGVVHVATSLVAQVDAAIGGKTGINLALGKNLVGTFHQPLAVLCDTEVLATLPEREVRNGLAEVAKTWLLEHRPVAAVSGASLEDRIVAAASFKAAVVASDERDEGHRALLNYGHTLAHALETRARARGEDVRHGEAVAQGLAFAARLAHALGRIDERGVAYHDEVLAAFGLRGALDLSGDPDELITLMGRDKKAHHDLTFVLDGPRGFEIVAGVAPSVVREVLEREEER